MNRNAQVSDDFLVGSRSVLVSKEDRIAAVWSELSGLVSLTKFLVDRAGMLRSQGKEEWRAVAGEADLALSLAKHLRTEIEATETIPTTDVLRKKYPNFFERQEVKDEAKALGKSEEVVLANRANVATAPRRDWKTQKVNRNIAPGKMSVTSLWNVGGERDLVKEKSVCARHCSKDGLDVQGRSNCPRCHGAGFHAMTRVIQAAGGKH